MKSTLFFLIFFFFSILGIAQYSFPEDDFVFDDNSIPRIDIEIHPDSLSQILNPINAESNHEYLAKFTFTRENQIETIDSIGFRLRGNTSRRAAKKSYKVSFNSIIKNQKFFGLEKMNLNGEHNDPTIIRSKVCWDLYRMAKIPCSRSNPILLYINNTFYGIYINVEHIDEEFIEKRFTNKGGNLFKCLYPADLKFKGTNPELYKEEYYGRRAYSLKTNKVEDDYSQFAKFIHILNNTQGESFICQLESIFDVENYLRAIAMDVLVSNWDGPIPNKNNFYLYYNADSERFTYIPYDLDNTLGIDFFQVDWAKTEIFDWASYAFDRVPIYENILRVQQYRDKLNLYFKEFIHHFFNNEQLDPYLNDFRSLLLSHREQDVFAFLDYGFTAVDFIENFNNSLGNHVTYGLKDYVETRSSTALSQTFDSNVPLPIYLSREYKLKQNSISFDIQFDSLVVTQDVVFHYQIGEENWESAPMAEINLGQWQHHLERPSSGNLNYFFEASNSEGSGRSWPNCNFDQLNLTPPIVPNLVINEFLASNDTEQTDEANEFEDWIELYNGEDTSIVLHNFYLTDDSSKPNKWSFPEISIPPKGYLTIWADEDQEQGNLHTNFKLSKNGEFLGLYMESTIGAMAVDSLSFPSQETDISFGRIPNGSGDFRAMDYTTFGYNNEELSNLDPIINNFWLKVFPNPTKDYLHIELQNPCQEIEILISDLTGKNIFKRKYFNVNHCILPLNKILASKGMYFLHLTCGHKKSKDVKFIYF